MGSRQACSPERRRRGVLSLRDPAGELANRVHSSIRRLHLNCLVILQMTHTSARNEARMPARQAPRRGLSVVKVVVAIVAIGVLIFLLMPTITIDRQPTRRQSCKNNLKQIGLALHNYHDTYGSFPPAYTVDADGNRLHSWRTLILPFLDQQPLYDTMDLTKPWNDPANAAARETKIPGFSCPSADIPPHHTTYVAVVGEHAAFPFDRGRPIKEFADGGTESWLVVEVDAAHAVPWMAPQDTDEAALLQWNEQTAWSHQAGFHALYGDGAVRYQPASLSAEERRASISESGDRHDIRQ